jgi:type IV pilus assembly protein PilQ
MNNFSRASILCMFAVAGILLAIVLAVTSGGPSETASAAMLSPLDQPVNAMPPPTGSPSDSGAIVEHVQPKITQNAAGLQTNTSQPSSRPAANTSSGEPSQTEVLQQLRQALDRAAQQNQDTLPDAGSAPLGANSGLPRPPQPGQGGAPDVHRPKPRITKAPGEGDDNLSIHIQDSDLRDVLQLLSEQGGLNILPSANVQGKVPASLTGVDVDTALDAILRSTGYVARRDGRFVYVGTPQDFKQMEQSMDKVATRVYRLNYVRASDVQALVTPLLTPSVGSISVTAAAEDGIAPDNTKAGGNHFAGGDSILVHDFVAVLDQIDQVVSEIDRKPAQVSIEAMILKVTLNDANSFGVDFAFLRNNPNVRLITGQPLASLDSLKPNGGLQLGYLDGSTAAFVSALETIGDTNIVATPKLMVIDKARAEILIGNQDGYVNSTVTETSTAQNVQFLETGAQLRLRPFISSDGLVRMEVHPELSTGNVEVTSGPNPLTLPHKDVTQVTTNIMVPDGCTVIIGGLMREELGTTTSQIPLLGSMPGIGFLFRHKTETTVKKEIVVLITPHIVCEPDACCEGDKAAAEFHRREAVYADQMSPLGKRYLGRKYYRLAQAAWARGDQQAALRFVDLAVHFDPESRAAIDLRTDIWNGNLTGQHTLIHPGATLPPEANFPPEMMPLSKNQAGGNSIARSADLRNRAQFGQSSSPNVSGKLDSLPVSMPTIQAQPAVPPKYPATLPPATAPKQSGGTGLDGEQMPAWLLDGLLQGGAGAPTIAPAEKSLPVTSPLLLSPGDAQPVLTEPR